MYVVLDAMSIKYIIKIDGGRAKQIHPNVFSGIRYGRWTIEKEMEMMSDRHNGFFWNKALFRLEYGTYHRRQ